MNNNFDWNKSSNLISIKWSGQVYLNDIHSILHKLQSFSKEKNIQHRKVFIDITKCTININADEVSIVSDESYLATQNLKSSCLAILSDKPNETALAFLFTKNDPENNVYRKVFSTEEAAKEWLDIKEVELLNKSTLDV